MRRSLLLLLLAALLLSSASEDKRMKEINSQIDDIERKLAKLKADTGSVLNEIYQIELRYEKEKIETHRADLQLRRTARRIELKEREKKALEIDIERSKQNIETVLRILYKFGGNATIKLFIRVDNFDQLFKNYRLFMSLIDYNAGEIQRVKKNIIALDQVKRDLQGQYDRILKLKRSKEASLRQIANLKFEKLDLIGRINQDRSRFVQLLEELRREAGRLNEFMSRDENAQVPMISIDLSPLKGRLEWPLKGRVISSFGRMKSTRFDTYIFNDGIEIQPLGKDKILAIYQGEVVYAEYFKGYGNLIIIRHAKNFHSLYGHCEKILVKKGDWVQRGDHIALAGDTGSTLGKSLYFGIREDLKPQNPLIWLKKKAQK